MRLLTHELALPGGLLGQGVVLQHLVAAVGIEIGTRCPRQHDAEAVVRSGLRGAMPHQAGRQVHPVAVLAVGVVAFDAGSVGVFKTG